MEKIISILEVSDDSWDGYKVTTDKREIKVLISNGQCCCESWGQLSSADDLGYYVGAELLSVETVDTALNTKTEPGDLDEGEISFVNFNTDKGKLQLAVYDCHNGYYGHSVDIDLGIPATSTTSLG